MVIETYCAEFVLIFSNFNMFYLYFLFTQNLRYFPQFFINYLVFLRVHFHTFYEKASIFKTNPNQNPK